MSDEEVVQSILEELYQEGWEDGFSIGQAVSTDDDPFLGKGA